MKYKDTLRQYLNDRQRALQTYLEAFETQIKDFPEMKQIAETRKQMYQEALNEINKVITYCEKRGRF